MFCPTCLYVLSYFSVCSVLHACMFCPTCLYVLSYLSVCSVLLVCMFCPTCLYVLSYLPVCSILLVYCIERKCSIVSNAPMCRFLSWWWVAEQQYPSTLVGWRICMKREFLRVLVNASPHWCQILAVSCSPHPASIFSLTIMWRWSLFSK